MKDNIKNNTPIKSIQKNKNITLIVDGIQQKKGQDIVVIDLKNIIIAYEPIWSIGTGLIPEIDQILEIHDYI